MSGEIGRMMSTKKKRNVRHLAGVLALSAFGFGCSGGSNEATAELAAPAAEPAAVVVTVPTTMVKPVTTPVPADEQFDLAAMPCDEFVDEDGYPLMPCESGIEVEVLQRNLALIFPGVAIDGLFGGQTFRFVQEFQESNELDQTGVVTEELALLVAETVGGTTPLPNGLGADVTNRWSGNGSSSSNSSNTAASGTAVSSDRDSTENTSSTSQSPSQDTASSSASSDGEAVASTTTVPVADDTSDSGDGNSGDDDSGDDDSGDDDSGDDDSSDGESGDDDGGLMASAEDGGVDGSDDVDPIVMGDSSEDPEVTDLTIALCQDLVGKADNPLFTASSIEACSAVGVDLVGEA